MWARRSGRAALRRGPSTCPAPACHRTTAVSARHPQRAGTQGAETGLQETCEAARDVVAAFVRIRPRPVAKPRSLANSATDPFLYPGPRDQDSPLLLPAARHEILQCHPLCAAAGRAIDLGPASRKETTMGLRPRTRRARRLKDRRCAKCGVHLNRQRKTLQTLCGSGSLNVVACPPSRSARAPADEPIRVSHAPAALTWHSGCLHDSCDTARSAVCPGYGGRIARRHSRPHRTLDGAPGDASVWCRQSGHRLYG